MLGKQKAVHSTYVLNPDEAWYALAIRAYRPKNGNSAAKPSHEAANNPFHIRRVQEGIHLLDTFG
jgi:hypothetical protein